MKTYSSTLAFLLLILVVSRVGADESPKDRKEVKVWSDSSGKFRIEADFIELVDDKLVVLKRASDGKEIKVPFDKLDEESKSQAKRLHADAQQSSLDPATEKQLEEMGLTRQGNNWRLRAEIKFDNSIRKTKKVNAQLKRLNTNKAILDKRPSKKSKSSSSKSNSAYAKKRDNLEKDLETLRQDLGEQYENLISEIDKIKEKQNAIQLSLKDSDQFFNLPATDRIQKKIASLNKTLPYPVSLPVAVIAETDELRRSWWPNRQKSSEGRYKDEEKVGPWTFWHENGQKAKEGNYKNDSQEGLWTFWHEYIKDQKEKEGHFRNGIEHGLWTEWYNNGPQGEAGQLY